VRDSGFIELICEFLIAPLIITKVPNWGFTEGWFMFEIVSDAPVNYSLSTLKLQIVL